MVELLRKAHHRIKNSPHIPLNYYHLST